jgi:hypothetical protein
VLLAQLHACEVGILEEFRHLRHGHPAMAGIKTLPAAVATAIIKPLSGQSSGLTKR